MAAIALLPPTTAYYEAWTAALTDLVAADAVASPSEIAARVHDPDLDRAHQGEEQLSVYADRAVPDAPGPAPWRRP